MVQFSTCGNCLGDVEGGGGGLMVISLPNFDSNGLLNESYTDSNGL